MLIQLAVRLVMLRMVERPSLTHLSKRNQKVNKSKLKLQMLRRIVKHRHRPMSTGMLPLSQQRDPKRQISKKPRCEVKVVKNFELLFQGEGTCF